VVFSFLGLLFFVIAGILLVCLNRIHLVSEIVIVTLCFVIAFVYLIDITMVLA